MLLVLEGDNGGAGHARGAEGGVGEGELVGHLLAEQAVRDHADLLRALKAQFISRLATSLPLTWPSPTLSRYRRLTERMVKKQVVARMPAPISATIEHTEYLNFSDEMSLATNRHN